MGVMKKLAVAVSVTFTMAAASPPTYQYMAGNLSPVPATPTLKTDAVIVFTGANDRLVEGFDLYMSGYAAKMMITGDDYAVASHSPEIADLAARSDPAGIFIDLLAGSTIDNGVNGAKWAVENNVHTIRLITSENHMARAYFELRRVLPRDIQIYADSLPSYHSTAAVDTEGNRLICRVYEATVNIPFCYQLRDIAQNFGLK